MKEAGKNYRGPKVWNGARGPLMSHTFLSSLVVITRVMRRWSVVLSVHAASDHLANDALCPFPIWPVPVRPCRGARKMFSSEPEPALCGPAYEGVHSTGNFISMLRSNFDDRMLYHCCIQWRTQEFCSGGGSTNSVENKGQIEWGSGSGSPLVRGSGGSCNLVQEISFLIVKFP